MGGEGQAWVQSDKAAHSQLNHFPSLRSGSHLSLLVAVWFAIAIRLRSGRWQMQVESRSRSNRGIEIDRTIMPLHDLVGLRQSDSTLSGIPLKVSDSQLS